jgi:hypothetical protein
MSKNLRVGVPAPVTTSRARHQWERGTDLSGSVITAGSQVQVLLGYIPPHIYVVLKAEAIKELLIHNEQGKRVMQGWQRDRQVHAHRSAVQPGYQSFT